MACCGYASLTWWLLGFPDRALGKSGDALTLARESPHTYSLGFALHTAAWLRQYRQEGQALQEYAEEEIRLSEEDGFALWLAVGTILRGWVLSEQGARAEGLAQMHEGLPAFTATGAALSQPYHLALLAQAHGKNGHPYEGLALLDQALASVDKTGERYYEAELYRLQGELTLKQVEVLSSESEEESQKAKVKAPKSKVPNPQSAIPNPQSEAETCFLQSLAISRQQQAKSWELRASMSLARLWHQQGKTTDARELLEDIYEWFTEGFDTKDLQDAAALLRELGGRVKTGEESQKSKGKSQKAKVETADQEDETRIAHSPIRPFVLPPAPST